MPEASTYPSLSCIQYTRFGVMTGFVLLLILLIANAVLTRRQLDVQVQNQARVERIQQILIALNQTQSLIKDAETGQRGYLYSGDPQYLDPYHQALAQLDPQLRLLQQMFKNPAKQAEVAQLRTLTQAKLAELAETIRLYNSGDPDAARALVLSDRGRLIMVQIDNLIGTIQLEETSLESTRAEDTRRSRRDTYTHLSLASLPP